MVSKFQWKPFWLATQRDPQNDWTATQNRVNYDVFAQAPSGSSPDFSMVFDDGEHLLAVALHFFFYFFFPFVSW